MSMRTIRGGDRTGGGSSLKLWRTTLASVLLCASVCGQPPTDPKATTEAPVDPYGRTTPRGTVLGFLAASRSGDYARASLYLNTPQRGEAAQTLAKHLSTVVDRRLPAHLNQLSDKPEGSVSFEVNQDLVGVIETASGSFEIVVERVNIEKGGSVWLFSRGTLKSVPQLYEETEAVSIDDILPPFLVETRLLGVALFEWLAILVGLPLVYLGAVLLDRLLSPLAGRVRRKWKHSSTLPDPDILPAPIRLLLVALTIRLVLAKVDLPLLARQFWTSTAYVITVGAAIWLFISLNGVVESYLRRRLDRGDRRGAVSFIRFARRTADLLVIFVGLIVVVYYFGLNPTAALAGLGVGGIAVALAAQKTLENVIGGMSVIFDSSVHMGDLLRVSGTQGVVEDIGLRSTRIRTFERTVVSVPNGQLATVSVENLSLRDKFWFHHVLSLRLETTGAEVRIVLAGIGTLLAEEPVVETETFRVNFIGVGASSLQLELFAYLFAHDYRGFLKRQEELLLRIMDVVERSGARIAYPSQTMYVADRSAAGRSRPSSPIKAAAGSNQRL